MLKRLVCLNAIAANPAVGLSALDSIAHSFCGGKIIVRFLRPIIWIDPFRVLLQIGQISGIVSNGARLPLLVLGPGVLGRVGDGDATHALVVEDVAHVHIQSGVIDHRDFRRTVRSQNLTLAGAGNHARQIDLTACGFDILHH